MAKRWCGDVCGLDLIFELLFPPLTNLQSNAFHFGSSELFLFSGSGAKSVPDACAADGGVLLGGGDLRAFRGYHTARGRT